MSLVNSERKQSLRGPDRNRTLNGSHFVVLCLSLNFIDVSS